MSIQFDIAKQIIAETYDDNQDNFLTTCSCLLRGGRMPLRSYFTRFTQSVPSAVVIFSI